MCYPFPVGFDSPSSVKYVVQTLAVVGAVSAGVISYLAFNALGIEAIVKIAVVVPVTIASFCTLGAVIYGVGILGILGFAMLFGKPKPIALDC